MKLIKIVGAIALIACMALLWLAIRSEANAVYLENFSRTEAARRARWKKEPEPEPEPENENENEKQTS